MPINPILAAAAGLVISIQNGGLPPADPPQRVNEILCKTELQAMSLADSLAAGQTEPMAINVVNKAAGAEVCGRYVGEAVIEVQKTENQRGGLFMLEGLRFVEDGALAWTASWVEPFQGAKLERGT